MQASHNTKELVPVECLICAATCEALAVFNCGHYVCYVCGLHIHSIGHGPCPVCREKGQTIIVTRTLPGKDDDEDKFAAASLRSMEDVSEFDTELQCFVQGHALADEIKKLYECVCPVPRCWQRGGKQEPFCEMYPLQQHLKVDHGMDYCSICLKHRSVFLCEQQVYSQETLKLHMDGVCPNDTPSFLGHPFCRFCSKLRFYDDDNLLEHMKHSHFTCDLCNRSQFLFRYYNNRAKLLQHFEQAHMLCDHSECAQLDPMMRVFASDLELALHKQRAHGIRSRVALFTADSSSTNTYDSPSTLMAPATGGNANVITITFDHVNRQETVKLMQKCAESENSGESGNRKGKGKGRESGKSKTSWVRDDAPGLPQHFRSSGVLTPLMHISSEKNAASHASSNTRAFGVSESADAYNTKNKVPLNHKELQRALDAVLMEELPEMYRLQDFRACTAEFMSGKMLTMRYYNALRADFFPSENAFKKVFPLLVATVPLPDKRDALVEIEKMRNSPEVQHAQRMREEEAKKKRDNEKRQKQYDLLSRMEQKSSNRRKNSGGTGGHNVWMERGSADLIERVHKKQPEVSPKKEQQRKSQQPSRGNNNNNNNSNNRSSSAGSANMNTANRSNDLLRTTQGQQQFQSSLLQTGLGYYQNPEDLPELPTTKPRGGWGRSQAVRTQRPNAWNCKRN